MHDGEHVDHYISHHILTPLSKQSLARKMFSLINHLHVMNVRIRLYHSNDVYTNYAMKCRCAVEILISITTKFNLALIYLPPPVMHLPVILC